MANVPIEVVVIGNHELSFVPIAIELVNAEQIEFKFELAPENISSHMQMHAYEQIKVREFFDQLEGMRKTIRGYHPFVIAAVDSYLVGQDYANLFGNHRAVNGLAVVTTNQVAETIIPSDRMAAYFVYYFARYALSFMFPEHRNHEDTRDCVFDQKVQKQDLIGSMRARALCDECRRTLVTHEGMLSASQFNALEKLFNLAGKILSEGLKQKEEFNLNRKYRIFIGSSSEGLVVANKLQELLSSNFLVVVWNQGTVFGLGTSTLEALEAAVLSFEFAIFIFTPDDQLNIRGQTVPVARDNVLFELGMFTGKLGRKKAFVVRPEGNQLSLPNDLAGITTAHFNSEELKNDIAAALGPVANRIRTAVLESSGVR